MDNLCPNQGSARLSAFLLAVSVFGLFLVPLSLADTRRKREQTNPERAKPRTIGNLQVTTASKEPEAVWKTAAAIYVITHEAILRSGATSIPEALRLAPGVEVARIDATSGLSAFAVLEAASAAPFLC